MRILPAPSTLILLLAGALLSAADAPANVVCPMSGKPIDPALGTVAVKLGDGADAPTVHVGTCTKECAAMLVGEPKTNRVRVWATMKEQQAQQRIKGFPAGEVQSACCNVTCPVDGKPIDATLPPLLWKYSDSPKNPQAGKAVLIGFCSAACMETFKKEPAKFEEPVWMQEKNKLVK